MASWQLNWTSERSIWVGIPEGTVEARELGLLACWLPEQHEDLIRSVVPSARGILVEFQAHEMSLEQVKDATLAALEAFESDENDSASGHAEDREISIPVCYDDQLALDLGWVAEQLGCHRERVIEMHMGATYRVECVGFMPGFGYLTGLDHKLRLPRRANPRTRVASGSVAIVEDMTAVYPHQSAGGWHLIGQSPMRLFDPGLEEPTLLRVGDRVRFVQISYKKFVELQDALNGDDR